MKYFIFGGNGFVGRYLANALLERNEKVVVCDLHPTLDERVTKGCEYRQTDIRDKQQLSTIPISVDDIIINLAANQYHTKVPRDRRNYFFSVNTVGTENILEAIYNKGCRNYLMFTTDMTYGKPQYFCLLTLNIRKILSAHTVRARKHVKKSALNIGRRV